MEASGILMGDPQELTSHWAHFERGELHASSVSCQRRTRPPAPDPESQFRTEEGPSTAGDPHLAMKNFRRDPSISHPTQLPL